MFHNIQQSEDFDDGFSLISGCPDFFVHREERCEAPHLYTSLVTLTTR